MTPDETSRMIEDCRHIDVKESVTMGYNEAEREADKRKERAKELANDCGVPASSLREFFDKQQVSELEDWLDDVKFLTMHSKRTTDDYVRYNLAKIRILSLLELADMISHEEM